MKATITHRLTSNTLITRLNTALVLIALAMITGCGQKGPLILEQVPVDQVQAPLENSTEKIPVETPAEAANSGNTSESESE